MKTLQKTIITGFLALTLFAGNAAYAAGPDFDKDQLQTVVTALQQNLSQSLSVDDVIKGRVNQNQRSLIAVINVLKNILKNLDKETEQEVKVTIKEKEKFDVTKTDRYPKQSTLNVTASAKTINADGNNNDYAEFEIKFDISAFGNNVFISENAQDALVFRIENASSGMTVYESDGVQNGDAIASYSLTADLDNGYYRLDEDQDETITVNISYNPYASVGTAPGQGSYRLVMESVEYAFSKSTATNSYNTRPTSKFRTKSVNIIN